MSDTLLVLLKLAGTILCGVIIFVLGRRDERRQQSLSIRVDMLKPIENWLQGVEKMVGILGDTLNSVTVNSRVPVNYDFDERRKAANFMIEKTNEVLGILASESLRTRKTKHLSKRLSELIILLDNLIKLKLLPADLGILERSAKGMLTPDFVKQIGFLKENIDSSLQESYSLIAQIKTALT